MKIRVKVLRLFVNLKLLRFILKFTFHIRSFCSKKKKYVPLPSSPIICPHPPHPWIFPSGLMSKVLLPVPAINTIPLDSKPVRRLPRVSELTTQSLAEFGYFCNKVSSSWRLVISSSQPLKLSPCQWKK